MKTKLHPGCGPIVNEGWLNHDLAQVRRALGTCCGCVIHGMKTHLRRL